MASYARVKIKKDQNLLNKTKQKLSRQFKLIRPMCSLYTCLRRNAPLEHDMYIYMCSEKSLKIIWNSHNLFEGRSPIILRGRECIIFFQVLFKGFFLIILLELSLFDLWLFRSFYLRRSSAENLVERDFLIRILFQVYFDFA